MLFFNPILNDEFTKRRATTRRFTTESEFFYNQNLHPRVRDIVASNFFSNTFFDLIQSRVTTFWNFPLNEQSQDEAAVYTTMLATIIRDYLALVHLRRLARPVLLQENITIEDVASEFGFALINVFWDLFSNFLIENYPLVYDDLRLRAGRNGSNDRMQTEHNNRNFLDKNTSVATNHANISLVENTANVDTNMTNTQNSDMMHADAIQTNDNDNV